MGDLVRRDHYWAYECVGLQVKDEESSLETIRFRVDLGMTVPKQMVTKSLYDYTIRELAELYKEMHPDEEEEEWFGPDDFDERDAAVAKKIGKSLGEVTLGEVLEYIDKERPQIAKEFNKCMLIAKDAQKHGRVWTEDNPLKTLVSRKDISIFEAFTMYEVLCDLLELGRNNHGN